MKWIDALHIKFLQLTYLMIIGISQILRLILQIASDNWSVSNLRRAGSLKPHTHFEWKSMKKHDSTTFRYPRVCSAYVMSIIMIDCTLHICQSHMAISQSRQYSVLMSEYKAWLANLWQSHTLYWDMIKIQVHRSPGDISLWPIDNCISTYPNWHQDSPGDIQYLY